MHPRHVKLNIPLPSRPTPPHSLSFKCHDNDADPTVLARFGPSCLQLGSKILGGKYNDPAWPSINVTSSSEDCLYLNVYTPVGKEMASLPVMLYLHAGEFRFGSSNDQESNWPGFNQGSSADVVLVTANARLGLFGFGALDAFRKRDPKGSAGNYGLQDQRFAMQAFLTLIQR